MAGLENTQEKDKTQDGAGKNGPNLLDLHPPSQKLQLTKSNLLLTAGNQESAALVAMPLDTYLVMRQAQENNETYFQNATEFVTRVGRKLVGMDDASSKFEKALKNGDQAAMMALRGDDFEQRKSENKISNYSSAALKIGFLFAGPKIGLAGLTGVYVTDSAKPADQFSTQMTDAALGAAKGLATKFVFDKINAQSWNPILKGWSFGLSDQLIDTGLSRQTYLGPTGELDLKAGGLKTLSSVFSPNALIADAGSLGVSYALLYPLNAYTGGAMFKNALAAKLSFAGVSGLTDGSLTELNKQQDLGQKPVDWLEVAKKGGERGALNVISALPGSRLFPGPVVR